MRRLPVIEAFSHAIRSTTSNLSFAFHISWPWMAVLLPIIIAGNLYALTGGGDADATMMRAAPVQGLIGVIAMLAFSSIAVNWHRYVLLDEVPHGRDRLRLDDKVWRYFGNAVLIVLIVGGIGGAAGLAIAGMSFILGPAGVVIAIPAFIALIIFGIAAFYRLSIKLPAIALGRRDFGLRDAWRSSEGNIWPLIGMAVLYFLVALGFSLFLFGLNAMLGLIGGAATVALGVAVQLVFNWIVTILGITLLTSLYGFFVEGRSF